MEASAENFPREIGISKNINLLGLDKNIAYLISGCLTDKDLLNLCVASKGFYCIFHLSLEKRLMSHFLKYVVEGRLDKVEEILNRNPKLIFLQGDIVDLSGRVFKRITAFQYAAWALDKEMWELILRYLPEAEAYDQLMAFEQKRPDITEVHGKRFNFQPLLDTYQKYIDNFEDWLAAEQWDQMEVCWCKEVGGAQRQMPAWFVYVFCEEGEDKAWPRKGFKKNFTRDPKHLHWWFDQEYNGGKLGFKFAVWWPVGAGWRGTVWERVPRDVRAGVCGVSLREYRLYLNSCQTERASCRNSLNNYLKGAVEIKNSSRIPKNK